MILKISISF